MTRRQPPDTIAVDTETTSAAGDVTLPTHRSSTYKLAGLDTDLSLEDIDPEDREFLYSRLRTQHDTASNRS